MSEMPSAKNEEKERDAYSRRMNGKNVILMASVVISAMATATTAKGPQKITAKRFLKKFCVCDEQQANSFLQPSFSSISEQIITGILI